MRRSSLPDSGYRGRMLKGLAIAGAALVLLAVAAAGAFVALGGADLLRERAVVGVQSSAGYEEGRPHSTSW